MTKPGFEEKRLELFISQAADEHAQASMDADGYGDMQEAYYYGFKQGAEWMMEQLKQQQNGSNE